MTRVNTRKPTEKGCCTLRSPFALRRRILFRLQSRGPVRALPRTKGRAGDEYVGWFPEWRIRFAPLCAIGSYRWSLDWIVSPGRMWNKLLSFAALCLRAFSLPSFLSLVSLVRCSCSHFVPLRRGQVTSGIFGEKRIPREPNLSNMTREWRKKKDTINIPSVTELVTIYIKNVI